MNIGTGGIAGLLDTASVLGMDGTAIVNFNHSDDVSTATAFLGSLAFNKLGTGTLLLAGTSDYTGATQVQSGTLMVEGALGDTTTTVFDGATLGGTGSIAGDVIVNDGATIAPGMSPGTLTVGSLSLSSGSILDYELGQAGVIGSGINDLIEINGDLTLDGTMNITDAGGFGAGVYRLMNYGGSFTDNGLDLGALPTGFTTNDLFVQTAIVGQVNLINSAGVSLNFWDGAAGPTDDGIIQGGDGLWVSNDRSWTNPDGSLNGNWNQGFAIFGGAAGTVTVHGRADLHRHAVHDQWLSSRARYRRRAARRWRDQLARRPERHRDHRHADRRRRHAGQGRRGHARVRRRLRLHRWPRDQRRLADRR